MTTLIVFIKRAPHLSQREFSDYWRNHHAPLIKSVPEFTRHLVSYTQYHLSERNAAVAQMFGVSGEYDGVAVLAFKGPDDMAQAFAEPRYLEIIRPDEPKFVDLDNGLSFIAEAAPIV